MDFSACNQYHVSCLTATQCRIGKTEKMKNRCFLIKAVLFDFDGTLTQPGALVFPEIKKGIGCPPNMPILEFIAGLENHADRESAMCILNGFEMVAASISKPNQGAEELIRQLKRNGVLLGIISRNSKKSIGRAFENFREVGPADFDIIISRDVPVPPKPSPEAILYAARKWDISPEHILMVGDFVFDVQSGKNAGALTVWLNNGVGAQAPAPESDFTVETLSEVIDIMRLNFPMEVNAK